MLIFFSFSLYAQRSDFYDVYDYDLKNYKGSSGTDESFREYNVPPKFTKPPLVTPKNVQRPVDSSIMTQQAGIRKAATGQQQQGQQGQQVQQGMQQGQQGVQQQGTSNLPFNPLTGQFNPEAYREQQEKKNAEKEKRKQFMLREKEPYTETRTRRMEIIFYTSLPFTTAFAAGLAYLIDSAAGGGFYKSTEGAAFVTLTATGLALANSIRDINYYDEYMKKKEAAAPDYSTSQNLPLERNYQFSFTLGRLQY